MKDWFSWLLAPRDDMPTTVMITLNFLIIEAVIKLVYDLTLGACLRLIDRVRKSGLNSKVKKRVFESMQVVVLVLSILCFAGELFTLVYFVIQSFEW